jgi:putative transposase
LHQVAVSTEQELSVYMAYPQASRITLTPRQQLILEQIVRRPTSSQGLVKRVRLILAAAKGTNNTQLSATLQLSRTTVRLWRERWRDATDRLIAAEAKGVNDKQLTQLIMSVLQDSERPGTPANFSTEQVVQIVALACESPSESGRPVSHWTPAELADEAVKRGIVEEISPRSVGRFLKRGYSTTSSQPLLA